MHFENRVHRLAAAVHVIVRRVVSYLVITMVTHALCFDAFWLVTRQVVYTIWIQLHWEWLACRNNHRLKVYPFTKIVPNKLTKKQCLLRFLLEILDCKSFVEYYLILRDFERDKFTGKWFCKNVAEWCGDLFQRYQRNDLSEERSKTWIDIAGPSDWYTRSHVCTTVASYE
jgi:hypothetical protein